MTTAWSARPLSNESGQDLLDRADTFRAEKEQHGERFLREPQPPSKHGAGLLAG